jgi:hypothetical protein
MSLKKICGRRYFKRVILLVLGASFSFAAGAQQAPKAPAAAPRTIVLPQKTVAGAPATLAVLDAAGRLLSNVVVELSGGQKVTTDATGRAFFVGPGEPGVLTARIPGRGITASSTVVKAPIPEPQTSTENPSAIVRVLSYPHFLLLHDRFILEGAGFRGEADVNRVFLADQPCLVLASSPISLVVLPGLRIPIGATNLRVNVAGHDAGANPVVTVLLEFAGPGETPNAGAQGKLAVLVHGTNEPLAIEVRNASPAIIQFSRGIVERVTTSGGARNATEIDVKFLAAGDYTVTARLIPAGSAKLDPAPARQRLFAARAAGLLQPIDGAPQDILPIRAGFGRVQDDNLIGKFASLLESAWQEFQKAD